MHTHRKHSIAVPLCALLLLPGLASCAGSVGGGTGVQIDWINFVRFGGITYDSNAVNIAPSLLGPAFAKVQHKLEGNVQDPNYQSKDGDAAFLEPGTVVYTVKGYRPTFRLAAYENGAPVLFEADSNPAAEHGSDLLDVAGKVRAIGVNSAQNEKLQLGAMKDPKEIAALVAMVLAAPVNQNYRSGDGTQYVVVFYFNDGTTTSRMFWLKSGELQRGILLPPAFGKVIQGIAVKA